MPLTRGAKKKTLKSPPPYANPEVNGRRKNSHAAKQQAPRSESYTALARSRRQILNLLPTRPAIGLPAPDLYVWGASDAGQLGVSVDEGEDGFEISTPLRHPWALERKEKGSAIVSVACGGFQTYLLDELGQVWSCGDQGDGALGRESVTEDDIHLTNDESSTVANKFALIRSLAEERFDVARVVAGDTMGAVLSTSGELRVWGAFMEDGKRSFSTHIQEQKLPISLQDAGYGGSIPDSIASIVASDKHFIALTTAGEIYTWGLDNYGRLGRALPMRTSSRHLSTSQHIDGLCPARVVLGSFRRKAVCIGVGSDASFAVDVDGNVWGWGSNSRGQLGLGDAYIGEVISQPMKVEALSPSRLDSLKDERVVQICGGQFHTLFLTSAGRIYACGSCQDGELGIPSDHHVFSCGEISEVGTPTLVGIPQVDDSEDPVCTISSSLKYNMAATRSGSLFSWGFGPQGELGLGKGTELSKTPAFVARRGGINFGSTISCGAQHVAALFR